MNIVINRNNPVIHVKRKKEESFIYTTMLREGYQYLNPLDIENFEECNFHGIEFNNLFIKGNDVFVYLQSDGLECKTFSITKIGEIESRKDG